MEKEFIPYEQALALKELGFNEECFGFYYRTSNKQVKLELSVVKKDEYFTLAPLYQQAFRWIREKHGLHSSISSNTSGEYKFYINFGFGTHTFKDVYSYEEAELECLKKLIEIVKENDRRKI